MNQKVTSSKNRTLIVFSPFIICLLGFALVVSFKGLLGKWVFIPLIVIEWSILAFFILKFGTKESFQKWLGKPVRNYVWPVFSISLGLISIPVFVCFYHLLSGWEIWLPWVMIALINPWLEEFYWRGLLLDNIQYKRWIAILYSAIMFALYHAVFGVTSELFRGPEVVISTLIMGTVWGVTYSVTKSLWWSILAHFFVDFFTLSVPAFLELFHRGWH